MHPRFLFLVFISAACGPNEPPETDAGECDLSVDLGTGSADEFVAIVDGEPSELILGFQGFRMLRFTLAVEGPAATQAEVSAFMTITEGAIDLSQRTTERTLLSTANGFVIEEWLVFLNDTPPASLIGREAEIEVIVRAAGCVGGARARVVIRDEDSCVDHTIVLDAGGVDAAVGDAMACDGAL